MTRILEFIVAAIIVVVLAVVVGLLLPSQGHIERSVDVSHNIRHINDVLLNYRRFPEWGALRALDPRATYTLEGPDFGVGAKINWQSNEAMLGNGTYEVASNELDHQVVWNIENRWKGKDKHFTITFEPKANQRLTKITWAYDVDYGMDLIARYSGLYLHGDPASQIQANLTSLQSLLATIPNVDYTVTDIYIADVVARPELAVPTEAPRTLDEVAFATEKAVGEIAAVMKKFTLNPVGPSKTITTEWGDENYVFDVAQQVDRSELTIDGKVYVIGPAQPPSLAEQNEDPAVPAPVAPGQFDRKGNLVVQPPVVARLGYGGKALVTTWIGSPAGLPLMRLSLKAFANARGYRFNDVTNRYWDQLITDPATTPEEEQQYKVYLPIADDVAANEPPSTGIPQ